MEYKRRKTFKFDVITIYPPFTFVIFICNICFYYEFKIVNDYFMLFFILFYFLIYFSNRLYVKKNTSNKIFESSHKLKDYIKIPLIFTLFFLNLLNFYFFYINIKNLIN